MNTLTVMTRQHRTAFIRRTDSERQESTGENKSGKLVFLSLWIYSVCEAEVLWFDKVCNKVKEVWAVSKLKLLKSP